ncbi:MAG TPA: hypothetical protein VK724_13530 [Bryobacteraceae bacterium]|jgi:hypothetical protein|nr:hypothetical protein [Bryobacteraceae bacterium]
MATLPTLSAQFVPSTAALPDGSIPKCRHLIGLGDIKSQQGGTLGVKNGSLSFDGGKSQQATIPAASIDDVVLGSEVTQAGGKTGRVVKTAAMAAPFESGKALTILLRTKVDILTVVYHDDNGALHSTIFAVPKGLAAGLRTQLITAGAHASPLAEEAQK